jgi:hypothetical protein
MTTTDPTVETADLSRAIRARLARLQPSRVKQALAEQCDEIERRLGVLTGSARRPCSSPSRPNRPRRFWAGEPPPIGAPIGGEIAMRVFPFGSNIAVAMTPSRYRRVALRSLGARGGPNSTGADFPQRKGWNPSLSTTAGRVPPSGVERGRFFHSNGRRSSALVVVALSYVDRITARTNELVWFRRRPVIADRDGGRRSWRSGHSR